MPPLVLLHHVFAVEHLVADLAGIQLLAVLLLVLGKVAVGGEEARADVALECLIVCGGGGGINEGMNKVQETNSKILNNEKNKHPTCLAVVKL